MGHNSSAHQLGAPVRDVTAVISDMRIVKARARQLIAQFMQLEVVARHTILAKQDVTWHGGLSTGWWGGGGSIEPPKRRAGGEGVWENGSIDRTIN